MRCLRLLITGTGRCGTQYVKHALDRSGVPCSHETTFSPAGPAERPAAPVESSWLAVPHLDKLDPLVTRLAVTFRAPELVVGSYRRLRFLEDRRHAPFADYALEHVPGMRDALHERGSVAALDRFYVWTYRTALDYGPDLVYRPDRIPWSRLAELAGISAETLRTAAAGVPTNYGHHVPWPADAVTVTADDISQEAHEVYLELEEEAARWPIDPTS